MKSKSISLTVLTLISIAGGAYGTPYAVNMKYTIVGNDPVHIHQGNGENVFAIPQDLEARTAEGLEVLSNLDLCPLGAGFDLRVEFLDGPSAIYVIRHVYGTCGSQDLDTSTWWAPVDVNSIRDVQNGYFDSDGDFVVLGFIGVENLEIPEAFTMETLAASVLQYSQAFQQMPVPDTCEPGYFFKTDTRYRVWSLIVHSDTSSYRRCYLPAPRLPGGRTEPVAPALPTS